MDEQAKIQKLLDDMDDHWDTTTVKIESAYKPEEDNDA